MIDPVGPALRRLSRAPSALPVRRNVAPHGVIVRMLAVSIVALTGYNLSTRPDHVAASAPPSGAIQEYNKAQALARTGHCDRAIPLYLRAVTTDHTYVDAYVGLGLCYQNLGSLSAAMLAYNKAIALDATNYSLYIFRAGAEASSGQTAAAVADDTTALRLAPRKVPVYVSIANSFASYGDFADAIRALDRAIAVAPSDPFLYQQRANVYLQLRDTTRAYADYRQAITVARSPAVRATLYANLALVYDQQGDFNSADRAIARAIRLAPNKARFYLESATIHRDMGSLAAALSLYDHALRFVGTGPVAEAAHEGKGDILVKLGQRRAAIVEYKRALTLATSNDRARLERKIKTALQAQ